MPATHHRKRTPRGSRADFDNPERVAFPGAVTHREPAASAPDRLKTGFLLGLLALGLLLLTTGLGVFLLPSGMGGYRPAQAFAVLSVLAGWTLWVGGCSRMGLQNWRRS